MSLRSDLRSSTRSTTSLLMEGTPTTTMEGWLRKRGKYHHISSHWNERYFILENKTLSYYVRRGDMEPKGEFQLFPECRVSEIVVEGKETKKGHRRANSTASTTTNNGGHRTPELSLSSSIKRRHASLEDQETKRGILYTFRVIWPATIATTAGDGGITDPVEAEALLLPGTPTGTPERMLSNVCSEDEKEDEEVASTTPRPRLHQPNGTNKAAADHHATTESASTLLLLPNIRTDLHLPHVLTLDGADIIEPKSPLPLSPVSLKRSTSSFTRSPFTLRKNIKLKPSATTAGRSLTHELHPAPPPPPPQNDDQQLPAPLTNDDDNNNNNNNTNTNDNMGEEIIEALKAVKRARNKKKQRKIFASGGVVAATGALVTTTILTGGLSLATLLTVIGISTAAGTGGAIASRTFLRSKQLQSSTSFMLVLASVSLGDAQRWRNAIIDAIANSGDNDDDEEEEDDDGYSINLGTNTHLRLDAVGPITSIGSHSAITTGTWANLFQLGGHNPASALIPNVPASVTSTFVDDESSTTNLSLHLSSAYAHCGTKWKPLLTGWVSFLGIPTGLRIYEEEETSNQYTTTATNPKLQGENFCQMISVKGRSSPLLKAQIVLDANPVDAFMCLMSYNQIHSPSANIAPCPASSLWSSFRIVETLDDHTDIIHLLFRPLFLFPSWTTARDFCILRHWRLDDDGSYVMFYEPVRHRECPPAPNYVRGEMHGVYTIAPLKCEVAARKNRHTAEHGKKTTHHEHSQCLLMHMVQTDPKGWIPTFKVPIFGSQRCTDAFGVSSLLQILDVRDSLVNERFVPVSVSEDRDVLRGKDENLRRKISEADLKLNNKNLEFGTRHFDDWILRSDSISDESFDRRNGDVSSPLKKEPLSPPSKAFVIPRPSSHNEKLSDLIPVGAEVELSKFQDFFLPTTDWDQPDSNSFKVRGKQYLTDKKKFNAGKSIMELIGVDIVQVPIPERKGLCAHPKEFVQMSLQREKMGGPVAPPFIFAVNILLPGPPHFHLMIYYKVEDKSTIDGSSGTASSLLANKFFFGDSDAFRDVTFKLIPQIVEGNFIVRKAVGSTPAIMGLKLKQYYFSSDRFFELFLDVASSSVAAGVVALTVGYAKTLVVDMAFLLEAAEEWALPEKILGTCRLKNVDLHGGMRFCEPY